MIYDLNSAVPLSWYAGSDVGTVTVVVTDPNDEPHTQPGGPFTSGAPIGTYDAGSFAVTLPGRHTVTFTSSTGRVYTDVFDVRPGPIRALIGVQDAKAHLRLKANSQVNDDTIQGFIESASIAIENITGPMVPQEFTEYYDGGTPTLSTDYKPIIAGSVHIVEYYGTVAFTLAEQPLGNQLDAYAFTVDYVTGQIQRRTFGGGEALFAVGEKNIAVTYKAGRAFIPQNVQTATKELVRHLWNQTQVPGRPKMAGVGDDGSGWIPVGFAVPNFVVQLLQADQRPPGIA